MLSELLMKTAGILKNAAKPTAFLTPLLEQFLFNNVDFSKLSEQQKQKHMETIKNQMKKVQIFIDELSKKLKEKQVNQQFVSLIKRKMENGGYNIFIQENRNNVLEIVSDYLQNIDLLDKQEQDYKHFDYFQQMHQAVERYKKQLAIKEESIKDFKVVQSSGEYKILQLTEYESSTQFTKNTKWCVRNSATIFDHYKPPYYVVLKNYVPFALINMQDTTSLHEQYKVVSDAPISKHEMTAELAKISIDLMLQYHNGKLIYAYDYQALYPYYPIEDLVKSYQEGKNIPKQIFNSIIKSTLDSGNKEKLDSLVTNLKDIVSLDKFLQNVSTENQYKQIALKIYPKPAQDKTSDEEWIKSHVILQKPLLIKLLFQSFTSGKKGFGLFHRLLKFNQTEENINEYIEKDNINEQVKYFTYQGKTLLTISNTVNQLVECDKLGLKADNPNDVNIIFGNVCRQKSVDLPMVNWFIKNKMIPADKNTLYMVMKSKKDAIIKRFLDSDYLNFNEPMYGDVTPLFYAIKQKMGRVVDLFLQSSKIDKNASINNKTLFWYAFELDDYETVSKLLKYTDNINQLFKTGKCANHTLFSYAVNIKEETLIDQLLKNPNLNVNINSPIDKCIADKDVALIKKIMNHKSFDPAFPNSNGDAPIMTAIRTDNTFKMFELIAEKTNLARANIINKKNTPNMTPLMLAIDYDMPLALIKKYFSKTSFSAQKGNKSILDIILNKLDGKPNDKNMLEIKEWYQSENKTKSKIKQNDLYKQLLTLAYGKRENEFKKVLNDQKDKFDCLKQVDGKNIIYILSALDITSNFVEILLDFVQKYQKDKLEELFTKKYGTTTLYQHASRKNKLIMQKYYNCEQEVVKMSSRNQQIFDFVKRYLS